MSLSEYSVEELLAEVQRRLDEGSRCPCGPARQEYRSRLLGFEDRVGCTRCNLWDSPVKIVP